MRRAALFAAVLVLPLAGAVATPRVAQACTIDGKATALADGRRAVLSQLKLTVVSAPTWAPFSFPGRYHARTPVHLSEDRKQIANVLPTEALQHVWRWKFGDGTYADGWAVTHRYAHPGAYKIAISAYDSSWHKYFIFDIVRITIAR